MPVPCNFKDQITGETSIPSTWQKEATRRDAACQSAPLRTSEEAVQTTISALQVVNRTDQQVGHEKKPIQANLDGLQYVYTGVKFDEGKLAIFLESSKEDVLSILYRNAKSGAFDNYEPNWSQKSTDIVPVATLNSAYAVEGELHALAVSWNSNGSLVAVGYGRMDTVGWCHTSGVVCIWNLSRRDIDVNSSHHTLETDSFATCVAFHPTRANVLAVGLYSGEVVVYGDVTDNAPKQMSAGTVSISHREPVTFLQWTAKTHELRESHRYTLCSAAQDGRVLLWMLTNKVLQPVSAFTTQSKKGIAVGVQSACFARSGGGIGANVPSDDSLLIVGLENGEVARARPGAVTALPLRDDGTALPLDLDWLDGHMGPVQAVDSSPFMHNLCLTCSSDGSAHLYNVLERIPLATLKPSVETTHFLYAARFSPFRPSVIALVSRSSFLHIYDLQESQLKPTASLQAGVDGAAVLCMAFNHVSPEWLVTGDARGCVRVWRLPSSLIQATDLERVAMRRSRTRGAAGDGLYEEDALRSLLGFSL